jgi:phosphopantothenoylcysteine decarboxylase / phosphopantothenate---cysteine ligase
MFAGKKIVIGVSGGIAAYKAAELVRALRKASAQTKVVMTAAATNFVGPLTYETLSGNLVLTELFPKNGGLATVHIDWARWPDAILVCPATLDLVGKIANGLADDALTTIIMATTVPVIFCPAMNKEMYANKIYQANQQKLAALGYHFVAPGQGELACGEEGHGRLADLSAIINKLKIMLANDYSFAGKKVLVTAGPTIEDIDPVRFISNRSSGKMGFAIAEKAALRHADVTLVRGPSQLLPFPGVHLIQVKSALDMASAVEKYLPDADILIMAAAVSDFRAKNTFPAKIKNSRSMLSLELVPNPDILLAAKKDKGKRIHVGFSVETENEVEHSREKLAEKNLDLIVVNNPLNAGSGFGTDTNQVTLIDSLGNTQKLALASKLEVANSILDKIIQISMK